MTPLEIRQLFSQLQYERDVRKQPDERRRGQFRAGWEDRTIRGKIYDEGTLLRLTWHNLGYRFGEHFGYRSPEQIDEAFRVLTKLYEESGRASREGAVRPNFRDLSDSKAVLNAIAEYDKLGQEAFLKRYGYGKARNFILLYSGRRYDSKAMSALDTNISLAPRSPLRTFRAVWPQLFQNSRVWISRLLLSTSRTAVSL